jgi:PAS domain S-box-containing protein
MTTVGQPTAATRRDSVGVDSGRRSRNPLSVHQVVAATVVLGGAAVVLALAFASAGAGAFGVAWLPGPALPVALVVLTGAAELVAVRMRHDDDAVEELTLLDGVVVLNTLLLPVRDAVVVCLAGILLAYVVRRRGVLKTAYNLGVYASASTATALLIHATIPTTGLFDLRLVLAMVLGATAFVAINLAHMSVLLRAINGTRPWDVVREDAPLSLLTIIGTVGLTGTVLALSVTAPVLLPCAVLPAAALWYAYGVSAAKHEERRRSARVLEYSQVLASGPSRSRAIGALLRLVHQEFEATAALAMFHDGTGLQIGPAGTTLQPVVVAAEHRALLAVPDLSLLVAADLPFGWQSAMVAPLVVDGERVGTVVVATTGRAQFKTPDLTTLSPLVGSLGVAIRNADYMTQLFEETSKLRAVVEQASDGIVVLGTDRVVHVWSPAMARVTGVAAERAIGARLGDVLTADDAQTDPFGEAERRLTRETPRVAAEIQLRRPDGEVRSARFAHAGVFEGDALVRDVVIVRDLTAERQVQRMKGDFIATVSHELRTPLTPIKGYADMLLKRGDAMPSEKRARALNVIVDRADHLGRLVEDLLAASSIHGDEEPKHTLATEVADLTELVRRACEDFPTAAGRMRVELPAEPVLVTCDPTRAVQVASNLISNALKYSDDNTDVVVTVDALADWGRLTVQDRGLGIPSDQMERVFDRFHRVEDPMVMSTGGTGLGLFIARHLSRSMGGDLTAESTLGVGSTFSLILPCPAADGRVVEAS